MFWYGFDLYYLILVVPAMIFAMIAQHNVNSTFRKFSQVACRRGLTGAQAAELVLRGSGVQDVAVEFVQGHLTDHYDPRSNVIRLSSSVYGSSSVASVGVAAHEAGHAVQYAVGYGPIKLRAALIPVTQFGSAAAWPLVLIGLLFNNNTFFVLGMVFFLLATLFQLVTLPVEFNASARAIRTIEEMQLLYEDELPGAKKVLRAAAMTYVASLLMSLLQLLRFVLIFIGRGGGRDRGGSR